MPVVPPASAPVGPSSPSPASSGGSPSATGGGGGSSASSGAQSRPQGQPSGSQGRSPAPGTPRLQPKTPQTPVKAPEPAVIKHKLEDGREIDVDITSQLQERLSPYLKRKLKVDGQELEVDLEEAYKSYSLNSVSRKRFDEAAKAEKRLRDQVAQLEAALRDPHRLAQLLEHPQMLGPDGLQKWVEDRVLQQLKYEQMTEEQRAAHDRQRELEASIRRLENEKKEREHRDKQAKAETQRRKAQAFKDKMMQAVPGLLQAVGLPVDQRTARAFFDLKIEAIQNRIPISDEEIASQVAEEYWANIKHAASTLAPERLTELLGENSEKIRQATIQQVSAPGRKVQIKDRNPSPDTDIPDHIKTPNQYRDWIAAKRRGQR